VKPSDWITLTSAGVAALGIGAAIFTQIWQSTQENKRAERARTDGRTDRWLKEKRENYAAFLGSIRSIQEENDYLRFTAGHLDVKFGHAQNGDMDPAERERRRAVVFDILGELQLVAPSMVSDAATQLMQKTLKSGMTAFDWSLLKDARAVEQHEQLRPAVDRDFDEQRGAVTALLTAMRSDLGAEEVATTVGSRLS
jgi:hypothetical protein